MKKTTESEGIFQSFSNPAEQHDIWELYACSQMWRAVLDRLWIDYKNGKLDFDIEEYFNSEDFELVCLNAILEPSFVKKILKGLYDRKK